MRSTKKPYICNPIIGKQEVQDIIVQHYDMVVNNLSGSMGDNIIKEELGKFCDMIVDAVNKSEGKPYEFHIDPMDYIRGTI